MKKKLMKNLLLVLVMTVLCFAVGMTASAEDSILVGQCGPNATYTLNCETGELIISGSGKIDATLGVNQDIGQFAETLIINEGITEIGYRAFTYSENLKTVFIPESVKSIEDEAFGVSQMLEKIEVAPNNLLYCNDEFGVLFNKEKTELIQYPPANKTAMYKIPDSVQTIGVGAFHLCIYLDQIVFSKELITIEDFAFYGCMFVFDEIIYLPDSVKYVGYQAFGQLPYFEKIYVRGIDTSFGFPVFAIEWDLPQGSKDEASEIIREYYNSRFTDDTLAEKFEQCIVEPDEKSLNGAQGTYFCHAGSTAEAYAIENGIDYVLTHFFEGNWTYDYDNMIRYRKCIHCDELETEPLETTTDSDVEIIEPADPDTDFFVDVITDYVVIEETISNNVAGDFEIVKAFDITMKNKDGVHVQPDGTVKVKLPLDWSKDGVYKVYRVNDDGTLTDMNAYRQGSHMVFETDHFSVYVIVDESEKAEEPTTPDDPQEETKKDFFSKIIDWFRSLIDLIISWFNK